MPRPTTRRFAAPIAPARARQLELFDIPGEPAATSGMAVQPWCGLAAWHRELHRQSAIMRPRTPLYHRFEATARQLTPDRIRASREIAAIARLVARLSAARYPGAELHGLERVWTRAELGALIVEATNRKTLLDLGRTAPRTKGPTLDPGLLPDDRLAHLIQTHRDLTMVEALRSERERRSVSAATLHHKLQEE
ncbi:hypothetical protein [Sphingomonas sp. UYEF23]|uniref:hypothetical protein n=1 Tax=Sphingomonas sp. UYEF23 TaxID=1756408 RepID=UPI0033970A19